MSAEDIQTQQGLNLPGASPQRHVPADILRQLNIPGQLQPQAGPGAEQSFTPPVAPGAPPGVAIGTEATYSTLPANAGNFNWTDEFTDIEAYASGTGIAATGLIIQTRVVPQGRIFYLRDLRVNIIDITYTTGEGPVITHHAGIPVGTFTFNIARNNGVEVFNQQITVEPLDNYNPAFLVAGPGDVITITVTYDFPTFDVGTVNNNIVHMIWLSHLRGELLTPNNMPVPYTALKKDDSNV